MNCNELLTPGKIGTLKLKNRMVMSAMVTGFATKDGFVTDQYVNYIERRAKGSWGLLITENMAVSKGGRAWIIPGIWDDCFIEGLKRVTDAAHKHGTPIFTQIYHCGKQTTEEITQSYPVSSSPVVSWGQTVPHELSVEEIHQIVLDYGQAALRAKKAGFDGIELHCAHWYLLAQFLSAFYNKRSDQYGGSFMNRMRFLLEIIEEVRKQVGPAYPIIMRISGEENVYGGRNIEETKLVCQLFEQAGIDMINVKEGIRASEESLYFDGIPPMQCGHGWITDYAKQLKTAVNIPVMTVGRITEPLLGEMILRTNSADFISFGRATIADPDFAKKTAEGNYDGIRKCIGCMQGCSEGLRLHGKITCMVNPEVGHEGEACYEKSDKVKNIMIAGGGIAGMEAARMFAMKGHNVSLYEASSRLGGQFEIAGYPPYKTDLLTFLFWEKEQLKSLGVDIHMNTKVDRKLVDKVKPDQLVIACGSKPIIPKVPGIEADKVVLANDVLSGKSVTGDKILVIGGGLVGVETALFMAMQRKQVAVIEMANKFATQLDPAGYTYMQTALEKWHVDVKVNTKLVEVIHEGVLIEEKNDNGSKKEIYKCDTVVLAVGSKANHILVEELQSCDIPIEIIGDAVKARQAIDAINEGFFLAQK